MQLKPRSHPSRSHTRAFTLVELLVVVAIIGILIAMLLPALGKTKTVAKNAVCLSNQKQIGQLVYYYLNDNKFFFPASYDGASEAPCYWFQKLAVSYLGVQMQGAAPDNLCGTGKGNERIFICPEAPTQGNDGLLRTTGIGYGWNYLGITDIDFSDWTLGNHGQTASLHQVQQPSQTILTADSVDFNQYVIKPNYAWWWLNGSYAPATRHDNMWANYLMADGHVMPLSLEEGTLSSTPYWTLAK